MERERIEDMPNFRAEDGIGLPDHILDKLKPGERYVVEELIKLREDISIMRQRVDWLSDTTVRAYNLAVEAVRLSEHNDRTISRWKNRFELPWLFLAWLFSSIITATIGAFISRWIGR